VAVFLQGCHVEVSTASAEKECGPLVEACGAMFFANGRVEAVQLKNTDAEVPQVHCSDENYTYAGPDLECGWVNLVCVARSFEELREDLCFRAFNFTHRGSGLRSWPAGKLPQLLDPFRAPEPYRQRYFSPESITRHYWAVRNATVGGASRSDALHSNAILTDQVKPLVPLIDPNGLRCEEEADFIQFYSRNVPVEQHASTWPLVAGLTFGMISLVLTSVALARLGRHGALRDMDADILIE